MIINKDKKLLIITPPKTGSRITEDCFNNRYDLPVARHAPLYYFEKYINIDSYYKVLLVRNPWDWLVSRYFHYLLDHPEKKEKGLTFTDWYDEGEKLIINILPEYYAENFHDMGRNLNSAFNIDLIIRMESLQAGINKIQKRFYLYISDNLTFKSNRNKSQRDYKNFYEGREDIKNAVSKKFSFIINKCDYSFDKEDSPNENL